MNELQLENLMRGAIARAGQLIEVVLVNITFNTLCTGMAIFAVYLVTAVRTPQSYVFAPYVVAGSIAMAAKGGFLLHRKWGEYAAAERDSEKVPHAWRNPSIEVTRQNKTAVLMANLLAVAAIALPVLIYCYYQIAISNTFWPGLVRIVPSALVVLFSLWAWLVSSK